MAEYYNEQPELQEQLAERDPRMLLAQALYHLNYYVDRETDLSPVNAAQELISKALSLFPETPADPLNKEFEVSVVTRTDLIEQGFSEEVVLAISDDDMARIARKMGDQHVEFGGYWEDMEQLVNDLLGLSAEEQDEVLIDGDDCLGI